MQSFVSREGLRLLEEIWLMVWSDFDDFVRKYDSTVNPDNYAMRTSVFLICEVLGRQYRSGVIDLDTLFSVCSTNISQLWVKFKPILEEYRKREYGRGQWLNWEYLADALDKMSERLDPEIYKNWDTIVKKAFR